MGMLRRHLLALAVLFVAAQAAAERITIDLVTFESDDPELIAAYIKARAEVEAARAAHSAMSEAYYRDRTATVEQYNTAGQRYGRARKDVLEVEQRLDIVPTFPDAADGVLTEQEQQRQWAEERKVRDRLSALREQEKDLTAYRQQLDELLDRFEGHAAEAEILLALAEHPGTSYRAALSYLKRAAAHPVPSDPWGSAQQQALQGLASLYERHGAYYKAIRTLGKWRISERCGTGAMKHTLEKRAWIRRLRLKLVAESVLLCALIVPAPLLVRRAARKARVCVDPTST